MSFFVFIIFCFFCFLCFFCFFCFFKNLLLPKQKKTKKKQKNGCPPPLPIITEGYDVVGFAQTGTGKTAAYLIPVVKFVKDGGYRKTSVDSNTPQLPEVLILAPTRELVAQIYKTVKKFTFTGDVEDEADSDDDCGVGVCMVYRENEEEDLDQELLELQAGCNILIGTSGRVLSLIKIGAIALYKIKFFVLDEADKMLDMGFGPDIDMILDENKTSIPSIEHRQSLLFGATFRTDLSELARDCLKIEFRLIEAGDINSAQPNVEQAFIPIDDTEEPYSHAPELGVEVIKLKNKGNKLNEVLQATATYAEGGRNIP